jgi:hypothetical protein
MKLQKILISSLMALSGTLLFAADVANTTDVDKDVSKSKLADVSISVGSTYSYINPITDVDINTDPIQVGSLNVVLLPGQLDLHLGYSRTFTSTDSDTGKVSSAKHAAEQINVELPFAKIGLDGWSVLYNHYLFNTSLTPTGSRDVWMFDKTNTTAVTGSVGVNDQGVSQLVKGENGQLTIKIDRYEVRKYVDKKFMNSNGDNISSGSGAYLALFYEDLEKPFEDPTANWYYEDSGEKVIVIYSQANFKSIGLSFGEKIDDKFLDKGLNLSKMHIDLASTTVNLTDNFSLKDKLSDNYQLYRTSLGGEIAYKIPLSYIKGNLVFGAYANYDYYYIDDSTDSSGQSLPISDDYLVGARVALHF